MSIIPNNTDPSLDYVSQVVTPPLTVNGLVYNQVYAHTGVVDALNTTNANGYADPSLAITNNSNGLLTFEQQLNTNWISSQNFGGPNSAPIVLTYNLTTNTYYNYISFAVLNVSCFVELLDQNLNALPGQSTFIVNGGSDYVSNSDWYTLNYTAPSTLSSFTCINLRITRQNNIVTYGANGATTNIAYSVGVKDFSIKLNVLQSTDVPVSVLSGTDTIISQNPFGFIENYSYSSYPVSNAFTVPGTSYWKSEPQPVGDSIVFFYAQVSDPTPSLINTLYIDPIYSGCKFNVYYTTASTSGGTVDPSTFLWSPIQRDFVLRRGLYEIPATSCTYLKFEFTHLVPEAYDLPFDVVNRTINVFPYSVESYYSNIEQNIINGNATQYSFVNNSNYITSQTQVNNQVSPSTVFGLASQTVAGNNNWPSLAALNSSQSNGSTTVGVGTASQISDPSISYKLLDSNGNYNNQPYNEFLQRRFPENSVHTYNTINVPQSWNESYFVGVNYINAFYQTTFDDLRAIPGNLIFNNNTTSGTTSGFPSQDTNYVSLNVDNVALTPWFNTIDTFNSFNIGGLTTDWRSFLAQGAPIAQDPTLMNNISSQIPRMGINNVNISYVSNLGSSSIYSVSGTVSGTTYGIKSPSYQNSNNLVNYYDASFTVASGASGLNWYGLSSTTVTGTSVSISGTSVSGISVGGGSYVAAYNFTIPNVYSTSGTTPWQLYFGGPSLGSVGYMTYSPVGGVNYYFLVNSQASGNGTLTLSTQFINPTTSGVIAGTTVTGTVATITGGLTTTTLTGTNYISSVPSNTIQLVVSGSTGGTPYKLYQLGVFSSPTTTWVSPADRNNMRISGVARVYLPSTNSGTYRASLYSTDAFGNQTEVAYKLYNAGTLPVRSWFDVEIESFTGANSLTFSMQVVQVNPLINETFYVSMLAPFYHPVRYEFTNVSGTSFNSTTGWYPITTGINDPNYFISTVSGMTASGIQLRMTALDSNVYICGVSVIPYYKQSPLYSDLNIDYLGNSKTNETEARTSIEYKPYFQLNKDLYPYQYSLSSVAPTINSYSLS